MRSRSILLIVFALLVIFPPTAAGGAFEWTFTLFDEAEIAGPPGSQIGWGYTLSNLDSDNWLVPFTIDSDLFQHAMPLSLFDFPIVAPGATVSVLYNPLLFQGLYDLIWDLGAPLGFVNKGTFQITADWYDGDPFAGGNVIEAGSLRSAEYSATVTLIPEPSSVAFVFLGVAALAIAARRSPN